ncbi:MAG: tellurium resistance protein TerC [Fimbriimonas ginsengisoli]|uniref:Tellurium resistance protein TerC n=1 Tax=Fimbriimonas ginsengisoli TaxID=1005039 RepID=A0A931LTM8_FIMGI|nr:tellurium resistance protein TerC [Fimbriimonas ginsengisoli]
MHLLGAMDFHQTFHLADLGVVFFLVVLEALLSGDNALVLAIMVRHLPRETQRRALFYGLGGAMVFRLIAILAASQVILLWWLQAIGGAYLLALPIRNFMTRSHRGAKPGGKGFWPTVIAVEVADIAFALDSVLAGVAMIRSLDKLWVVYAGAVIGALLMRFAAGLFIKLMARYPTLDHVAYLLVGWVGVKMAFMAGHNAGIALPASVPAIPEMPALVFWFVMAGIAILGGWFALRAPQEVTPETLEAAELVEEAEPLQIGDSESSGVDEGPRG